MVEDILASPAALQGERKEVTVLFCDLTNSTGLAERVGPERMHTVLDGFFALALREVHRYEGTINQFLGDGFMALFGAPLAHEDHAQRAVLAALGIERALREPSDEVDDPLVVRMGLNTGPVVVGSIGDDLRLDYTAIGDTTNLAARLQHLAAPGAIVVSESTATLVASTARLEPIGPLAIKGKAEPVAAYRVIGVETSRLSLAAEQTRGLTLLVGRRRELEALRDLLDQARAGRGQVVGVVGEPGIGKSRLVLELRRHLATEPLTHLDVRCLSYEGAQPYLPLLGLLRQNCHLAEKDPPEAVTRNVRLSLREVGMDPDEDGPYLLYLLGLEGSRGHLRASTPEAIKARTFEVLQQLTLRGSRQRPLVLTVEDLHWIDKTSEEFLAGLVESLAGVAILLVTTYRPGYRPPWLEKSYATQIALQPLTPEESLAIVRAIHGERDPAIVPQELLAQGEGNPFFLEVLASAAQLAGDVRSDGPIPEPIRRLLMAWIDRLPDAPKRVLQTASVVGREIPVRLLEAMWEGSGPLDPHLVELKRLELLYEQAGGDEPVYVFRHALTQRVAAESLLTADREALQTAAAEARAPRGGDRVISVDAPGAGGPATMA